MPLEFDAFERTEPARLILTVTPNAAVDKTYRIDGFQLDRVNRPTQTFTVAGGKGINVARVYQTLGGQATATGFLGGNNGRIVARALAEEKIRGDFVRVTGETRVCIAVIDPHTGTQTEINEPGPAPSARQVRELLRRVKRLLSQTRYEFVVLSGSLPPDVPAALYAELIEIAHKADVRAVLDTSGDALREGLQARPWMVKPNRVELETTLGVTLDNEAAVRQAALDLHRARGIAIVALTQGAEGAVLATQGETWRAVPPSIDFASAVASGDSFVAAFLWAWQYGARPGDPAYALQMATGAGAANAAVIGAGFCTRDSIFALADRSRVERL